jgi:hypothetical protein
MLPVQGVSRAQLPTRACPSHSGPFRHTAARGRWPPRLPLHPRPAQRGAPHLGVQPLATPGRPSASFRPFERSCMCRIVVHAQCLAGHPHGAALCKSAGPRWRARGNTLDYAAKPQCTLCQGCSWLDCVTHVTQSHALFSNALFSNALCARSRGIMQATTCQVFAVLGHRFVRRHGNRGVWICTDHAAACRGEWLLCIVLARCCWIRDALTRRVLASAQFVRTAYTRLRALERIARLAPR